MVYLGQPLYSCQSDPSWNQSFLCLLHCWHLTWILLSSFAATALPPLPSMTLLP